MLAYLTSPADGTATMNRSLLPLRIFHCVKTKAMDRLAMYPSVMNDSVAGAVNDESTTATDQRGVTH
jgi:hypothetical protein